MKATDTNLNSERIDFRKLSWTDVNDIHHLNSNAQVAQYNTLGIPKDLEETRRVMGGVLNQDTSKGVKAYGWTIRLQTSQEFMGEVGMFLSAPRYKKASIFYNLLPHFWGHGYGTEAAKLLLAFGFENLKLHRIEAGAAVDNLASLKILEKIGMKREGRGIKILPIDGNWQDNYSYAILEEEWYASRQ